MSQGPASGLLPGVGLKAGEAGYFHLPRLLSPGVAVGADRATCSPAGICEWAPAPRPAPAGGPPRDAHSHWLDVAFFWYCSRWVEEAFFWPKNNTRVSAGTSLLHPLPSIVSRCTIPGLQVLPSQLGAGGVKPKRDQRCV